jgi:hypothetical protein
MTGIGTVPLLLGYVMLPAIDLNRGGAVQVGRDLENDMAGQDTPKDRVGTEKDEGPTEADDAVTIDPRVQLELGRALRAYTDDIINAPIPAKFLSLLARLEAEERRSKWSK